MATTAPERAADYHADRGGLPTLSSTIARLLIRRTPAHAKAAHPRLTPDAPRKDDTDAMALGTSVHQLLLRDDRVDVLAFKDYRTNAAQAARDESYAAGRVPMLTHKWEQAQEIAGSVRDQIPTMNLDPVPFTEGTAEHVIRWTEEDGTECRAMLDWLRDDRTMIDDLKTSNDASPRLFAKKVHSLRYDIQAAFYTLGVERAYGVVPRFRWVAVETEYPYLVTVHELDEAAYENAVLRVEQAIDTWAQCLREDRWPAYPADVQQVGVVPWERDAWSEVDVGGVPF